MYFELYLTNYFTNNMWETISHEAIDVNAHVQLQEPSFSWHTYAVSKILPNIVTGLILLAPSVYIYIYIYIYIYPFLKRLSHLRNIDRYL